MIICRLVFVIAFLLSSFYLAANDVDGFRSLSGHQAKHFQLPEDMELLSRSIEKDKVIRERYQQYYGDNIPVLGAQITIRKKDVDKGKDEENRFLSVTGAHYPNIVPQNTVTLSDEDAVRVVTPNRSQNEPYRTFLMINPLSGRFFYWVGEPRQVSYWVYWVDAEEGNVVGSHDSLAWSTGLGVNGDPKDLTNLTSGDSVNGYRMTDVSGSMRVYNAENGIELPPNFPCDDSAWDADDLWNYSYYAHPGQGAIVDAQYYANWSNIYYSNEHGFVFSNEYSNGIEMVVHFDEGMPGAFWSNPYQCIVFGDGDGIKLKESSGALELVAHEMAHAIVDKRVISGTGQPGDLFIYGLKYEDEPGALDEGFADIMGTSMEFYHEAQLPDGQVADWIIGEDIGLPENDPYIHRSMENPNSVYDEDFFCNHPSHYGDILRPKSGILCPVKKPDCDDGFVHYNSGIVNHWLYLLVNGGTNANTACHRQGEPAVEGIGISNIQDAVAITYAALVDLNYYASICDARDATITQADTMFSGVYRDNVESAWNEVGVTEQLCAPPDLMIESPSEGEIVGGPDEVILQGWAVDLGGVKKDVSGDYKISLSIKQVGQQEYKSLKTSSITFGVQRQDICPQNQQDAIADTCIWDSDAVCIVDTDPNCPDIGWMATFDSLQYVDGDYLIRLGAEDYQNDTEEYFFRSITIDNSHVSVSNVGVKFDTWVNQQTPASSYCDDQLLSLEGDVAGEYMYTYLHFEVPPLSGSLYSANLVLTSGHYVQDMQLWSVEDSSWQTCWPTWNNRPQGAETFMGSIGPTGSYSTIEIPVSSFVTGAGSYTFKLFCPTIFYNLRQIISSEHIFYNGPKLVIISDMRIVFADDFESGDASSWASIEN